MRYLISIGIFALTALAAGLFIDAYLQLAEIQSPLETYVDPEFGPSYLPDRDFSRFQEGFFLGGTNKWGTLGEGQPKRNEKGDLRVLVVGDSYVLGHTVFERHHFKRVLEADLEAALGQPVSVLNFARADFNLWNMHRYYRDFVCQWDHDLALLFVGQQDLIPSGQVGSELYPISYAQGDSVAADYSFRKSGMYRRSKKLEPVMNNLATPRLAFNLYKLAIRGKLTPIFLDKLAPTPTGNDEEAGSAKVRAERPPLPENSLAILRDMARDPRVVLVFKDPVHDEYRVVIDEIGLEPLDLQPLFDEMQARGEDPRRWPVTGRRGHWNHGTHVAIGHELADDLLERDLLEP